MTFWTKSMTINYGYLIPNTISNKYIAKAIISPTNKCLTKEQEQRQQTYLETIENLGSASRTRDFSKKIITS